MNRKRISALMAACVAAGALAGCGSDGDGAGGKATGKIVVASVNNGPMMTMKELTPEFTKQTGIEVEYVMLTENDIRSKIQQDVAVGSNQFDVVTIGSTDAGPYLEAGWTAPLQPLLDGMPEADRRAYDFEDMIPANVSAYSSQTKGLAALPLYGESTMLMYRQDLFDAAGLTMPDAPTWQEVYELAKQLNNPAEGVVGMAIRGKAGYGENMFMFNGIMNAYGAQICDMNWNATYDTPEMKQAWEFYRKLQKDAGAPEASSNGYTETLNLMSSGGAAIYFDATVSADVFEADGSAVKGKMGYAKAPSGPGKSNTQAVGGWGIALTSGSKNKDAAFEFVKWVTSKDYVKLVAEAKGWLSVPSGARESTYKTPEYRALAPYADLVRESLETVQFDHPAVGDTPYVGNTLPNIPEWSGLGERLGALLADYISSDASTDTVLKGAQDAATQAFVDGGRVKG
ncbi:MAG: sugar ABC transporter substrate-binding protein [Bifidobacteriaceae bacterium]|jgi:sorbitol/mannitol transport system substrate-binding protein|nr:sugar ABC transporter substrate-binding protein [Bifidobacteriaceae bacterium]